MIVLLMILSALALLALFVALIYFLKKIIMVLDRIGGQPDSYLAKLRMGLRAIEVETGHLPTQVTTLNTSLAAIGGGLDAVDERLVGTATAAIQQEG
ncbi:MAG TPA: hypothetical protein VKR83_05840 [Ktedonobacteraceae bacterium]|nr:hypothetical protein [Ktedonobacteraceae bacterium]